MKSGFTGSPVVKDFESIHRFDSLENDKKSPIGKMSYDQTQSKFPQRKLISREASNFYDNPTRHRDFS